MEQFDEITGYFEPKRMDTLRDRAKPFVSKLLNFKAMWLVEEEDGGPYVGQWAMEPSDENGNCLPIGWVPFEDIRLTE